MDMHKVVGSSTVDAKGYDPQTFRLRIKFRNGGTYEYDGVPQRTYDAFSNAESAGSYVHQNIKGKYPFRKVEGSE